MERSGEMLGGECVCCAFFSFGVSKRWIGEWERKGVMSLWERVCVGEMGGSLIGSRWEVIVEWVLEGR